MSTMTEEEARNFNQRHLEVNVREAVDNIVNAKSERIKNLESMVAAANTFAENKNARIEQLEAEVKDLRQRLFEMTEAKKKLTKITVA